MTNKYRFYLNGGLVHPFFGNDQEMESSIFEDQVFYRTLFTKGFTLLKSQFLTVKNAAIETEFKLQVQRLTDPSVPTWTVVYDGYFTKFDAEEFDEDNERVTFKLQADDRYRKFLEGWDKEINLIDLGLEKTTIKYKRYPILQLYLRGFNTSKLVNYSKGFIWEADQDFRLTKTELTAEAFEQFGEFGDVPEEALSSNKIFVFGVPDDLTHLCVGTYEWVEDGDIGGLEYRDYQQVDFAGTYKIRYITGSGNILLTTNADELVFSGSDTFASNNIVRMAYEEEYPGQFVNLVMYDVYTRLLCDAETTIPIPTANIPADVTLPVYGRKKYRTGLTFSPVLFTMNYDHTVTDNGYGQVTASPAIQYVGLYYDKSGATKRWPIAKSYWHDMSLWMTTVTGADTLLDEVTEIIEMADAYRIDRVIRGLIRALDVNLTHESNQPFYSNFLYNGTNPLAGVPQGQWYITAKTNITKPNYDKAATKVPIKPKEFFRALRIMFFGLMFDINANKNFILEHNYYFEQGGTYGINGLVGVNLNTLSEQQQGKAWSYYTNKYKYEKASIPGRIRPRWNDDVSDFFNGEAVEIISPQAEKERSDDTPVPLITTDINFMDTNPDNVLQSGLVMLEVGLDGFVVEPSTYNSDLQDYVPVQNGNLSFTVLADRYARHSLPAQQAIINGTEITAVSVLRQKIQEVELPYSNDLDLNKLVWTSLGKGKVFKVTRNIQSDKMSLTLKHKTE